MINKDNFNRIAEALLADYSSVYYVDAVTNEYCWYSSGPEFHSLQIEQQGKDFFENMKRDAKKVVHEEDIYIFTEKMQKENLLTRMKSGSKERFEYRLMIGGKPVYHTIRVIRGITGSSDDDYFVLGVLNIDREVRERQEAERLRKEREVYNHIADSLASNYDVIYYVNTSDNSYAGFFPGTISGQLKLRDEGTDFFGKLRADIIPFVHPNDKERISEALSHDNTISQLQRHKKFSIDYRMTSDGETQYMRVIATNTGDKAYILVCFENIDAEIQKEKDRIKALNLEKELARRDELTGTKNKTAYLELVGSVQSNIDNGLDYLTFAIVVCDINGLKQINDTEGHQAGDEYIRACADLICHIFAHSPVFRIGGDEFVVFVRGGDYAFKGPLFEKLRKQVLLNRNTKGKPVIASGISAFDPLSDHKVSEVFDRADKMMYKNKRELKGEEPR